MFGRARRDAALSIRDIDTYQKGSDFFSMRAHMRKLADENERLRTRLARCVEPDYEDRGRRGRPRPNRRRARSRSLEARAEPPAAPPPPPPAARDRDRALEAAGVRDLIKSYRNALRRANARIVALEARACEAEARAAAAAARRPAPPPAAAPVARASAPTPAPAPAPPPPPPRPPAEDGVAAILRDDVATLDVEIAALREALRAESVAPHPKPLEVRAREAARAILASTGAKKDAPTARRRTDA